VGAKFPRIPHLPGSPGGDRLKDVAAFYLEPVVFTESWMDRVFA
jgi:hypothetical protein